jgi:hypothetical protein
MMSDELALVPRLTHVVCATPSPVALAVIYQAIGAEVDTCGDSLIINIAGSRIEYRPGAQSSGIVTIGFEVDDFDQRLAEIQAPGIAVTLPGLHSVSTMSRSPSEISLLRQESGLR